MKTTRFKLGAAYFAGRSFIFFFILSWLSRVVERERLWPVFTGWWQQRLAESGNESVN